MCQVNGLDFQAQPIFEEFSYGGYHILKKIPRIYKKHIYTKNISYDPCKLSFMHNFHYSRVTKGLRIIILLKCLNYPNPGVMYYL